MNPQECPARTKDFSRGRVSDKRVLQECAKRASPQNVLQQCLWRECQARVSNNVCPLACLRVCIRVYSGSWAPYSFKAERKNGLFFVGVELQLVFG